MILSCVVFAFLVYFGLKTIEILFLIRKYKGIPGPNTNGYLIETLVLLFVLFPDCKRLKKSPQRILGFYLGNLPSIIQAEKSNVNTVDYFSKLQVSSVLPKLKCKIMVVVNATFG
jgi:hypothetical protein